MTDKIKVFTLLPRVSNLVALSFGQGERAAVSLRFVDKGSDHIDVIFRNLGSCNFKNEKEVILIVGILPFLGHFESLAKGRLICPYQRGRGGLCLSPEALGEHFKQLRIQILPLFCCGRKRTCIGKSGALTLAMNAWSNIFSISGLTLVKCSANGLRWNFVDNGTIKF